MAAHTAVMSSNLSQLAELAASQTPSQMIKHIPVPQSQPQGTNTPGSTGTRMIVPGQSVPFPFGPQVQASTGMIPPPFIKGSIIQLTSGELKRVEDLTTDDFVHSTGLCPDLKLETSTVVSVRKNDEVGMALVGFTITSTKAQVTLSCAVEHPFFVYGQGWSSCVPEQSLKKYNLQCHPLKVGDVCIFLTPNLAQAVLSVPGVTPGNGISQGSSLGIPEQTMPQMISQIAPRNSPGMSSSPLGVKQVQVVATQAASSPVQPVTPQVRPATPTTPVSSSAVPGSTFTVIDPQAPGQMGFFRPHLSGQALQQIIGPDGKPILPSGIPFPSQAFYQQVPASLISQVPGQSFVQAPPGSLPGQTSVGNGLLVTTLGFVPGQHGMPMSQQGMIYAAHLSEMAQKQGQETVERATEGGHDGKTDTSPEAKRPRMDVNTDGKC
ncbi:ataxin-1-like isoform X2 [Nematostella vectensis]|nr:ataxin-1-like isoform X2 [Nematostella vectensis]